MSCNLVGAYEHQSIFVGCVCKQLLSKDVCLLHSCSMSVYLKQVIYQLLVLSQLQRLGVTICYKIDGQLMHYSVTICNKIDGQLMHYNPHRAGADVDSAVC